MAELAQVEKRLRIGWCPVDRCAELQEFIRAYWRPDHVLAQDPDLLRWQYRGQGQNGPLSVLLAREGEQLVGFLGLIPVAANYYGNRVPGAWLAMWTAIPGERRAVTALALLREALDLGYAMVGCCGFNETTRRILEGLGFGTTAGLRRWVRVVSPAALHQLLEQSGSSDSGHGLTNLHQAGAAAMSSPGVRVLDWSDDAVARWDETWLTKFAIRSLGTSRDAGYLRWRYLEHPRFKYEIRLAEDRATGGVLGLIVYRLEQIRGCAIKVLRIVEFLGSGAVGEALARAVIKAGEDASVAFVDFYCSTASHTPALETLGFLQEDSRSGSLPSRFQPLEFKSSPLPAALYFSPALVGDNRVAVPWDDVYLTRSDGDQDRPS